MVTLNRQTLANIDGQRPKGATNAAWATGSTLRALIDGPCMYRLAPFRSIGGIEICWPLGLTEDESDIDTLGIEPSYQLVSDLWWATVSIDRRGRVVQ